MKKITSVFCALLAMALLFTSLPTVMAEGVKREFLIDGQLDPWYLTMENTKDDDPNTYHILYLDPYQENAYAPYEGEPETDVQVYTAYDSHYVYFYVKVWDGDIVKEGAVSNTDIFDGIEIYFDPDPLSENSDPFGDYQSPFDDIAQGDVFVKMHLGKSGEFVITTHEKEGFTKPGFEGVLLKEYFANSENVCGFLFDNDKSDKVDAKNGYGMEVRFPRNDDEQGAYRFSVASKNSGEQPYVLATTPYWSKGIAYSNVVEYSRPNPFFTQTFSWGDVNEDKAIDAKDALIVLKASVDKMDLNQKQAVLAEVDGKDGINAKDALEILKYSVKKITTFPVEEIVTTPTDITPTVLG